MSDFKEGIPGGLAQSSHPIPPTSIPATETPYIPVIQDASASELIPNTIINTIHASIEALKHSMEKKSSESSKKRSEGSIASTPREVGITARSEVYDRVVTSMKNLLPYDLYPAAATAILKEDLYSREGAEILEGKIIAAFKADFPSIDAKIKTMPVHLLRENPEYFEPQGAPFTIFKAWSIAKVLLHNPEMAARYKDDADKAPEMAWEEPRASDNKDNEAEKTGDKKQKNKKIKNKGPLLPNYYDSVCDWVNEAVKGPACVMDCIMALCDLDDRYGIADGYNLRALLAAMAHLFEFNYEELCRVHRLYETVPMVLHEEAVEEVAIDKNGRPVRNRRAREMNHSDMESRFKNTIYVQVNSVEWILFRLKFLTRI
ncbi:hypothetical protein VTL71DRAFT_7279 [Oculimacula yallundae]|uniref:Uncharacterized protein n=1 Tax=Oculimacula yallundae TaxID=86028 RepID=A0ABR4BWB2_9HELO